MKGGACPPLSIIPQQEFPGHKQEYSLLPYPDTYLSRKPSDLHQ